jgi:hypothetical protein
MGGQPPKLFLAEQQYASVDIPDSGEHAPIVILE